MIYNLEIRPNARKDLEKLDKTIQYQILKKLSELELNPNLGKPLSNYFKKYKKYKKLRVSIYRVLYFVKEESIIIVRIGHRKNIYLSDLNTLKSPCKEDIIVVNNLDEIISYKERSYLSEKDNHRSSALIIKNKNNEVLLAQRALKKNYMPGKFGPSVDGTCQKGEDYIDTVLRETEEELNLVISESDLNFIEKIKTEDKYAFFFTSIFFIIIDENDLKFLKLNKKEVKSIEWFSKEKLKQDLQNNPNKFLKVVSKFLDYY
jgi:mRNA interferase RelE/StbE